jgi:hypothetical protein
VNGGRESKKSKKEGEKEQWKKVEGRGNYKKL